MSDEKGSFWTSLAGVLTGVAALITAGTTLWVALNRATERQRAEGEPYSTPAPILETDGSASGGVQTQPLPAARRPCSNGSLTTVRRIVASQLGMNPRDLVARRPLGKQPSPADDLDLIEIVMAIEAQCSVSIEDSEVPGLADGTTAELLARLVDQKVR